MAVLNTRSASNFSCLEPEGKRYLLLLEKKSVV